MQRGGACRPQTLAAQSIAAQSIAAQSIAFQAIAAQATAFQSTAFQSTAAQSTAAQSTAARRRRPGGSSDGDTSDVERGRLEAALHGAALLKRGSGRAAARGQGVLASLSFRRPAPLAARAAAWQGLSDARCTAIPTGVVPASVFFVLRRSSVRGLASFSRASDRWNP
jgi:hypothetical protein